MHKILIIDDNPAIHEDVRKILCPAAASNNGDSKFLEMQAALFGAPSSSETAKSDFQIDSAFQGQEALGKVEQALSAGEPYALAFVDMRMPPGWDGIETIQHLWEKCPDLQVVICTAFSDHSWSDITRVLGNSDNLVILKKPYDNMELLQLAHALTKKWALNREVHEQMSHLDEMVRARTEQLSKANEQLQAEMRQRLEIEAALRASEERFQKAFQSATVPMAILRAQDQTCVEVNDSLIALAGRPREEMAKVANDFRQLIHPDDLSQLSQRLRVGQTFRDFYCRIRRNGEDVRDTLVSASQVTLGNEKCLLLALHDVTEQRQLESQLRQAQKMEAIGQLAAGVAHDFNNLLTVILGYTSIQLSRPGHDAKLTSALEQVRLAAERASSLTKHLLAFSRKQVIQRKTLQLNETVARIHPMLLRMLGETITLQYDCQPALPLTFAHENSIEQVIMNLVVNARDAMSDSGTIRIAVQHTVVDAAAAKRNQDARPGDFICLSVADNGCGMNGETLARVFEPFFTTKPKGKGTGLGLSTVYGIVKQHEGWVEVDSHPNVGSTFRVYLPVNQPLPELATVATKQDTQFIGKAQGTILVVEDEDPLREFMTLTLSERGYNVLEAGDGPTALQVWQKAPQPIDLLLTDMMMPNGISGAELARRLLGQSGQLRVLYTSGYSTELIENGDQLVEGTNFLPKPFDNKHLLTAVRRCFDGKMQGPLNRIAATA